MTRLVVVLACVAVLASVASAQTPSPRAGRDAVRAPLTSHPRWTLYWDRGDLARPVVGAKPADGSPTARVEFMSVGRSFVGHLQDDRVLHAECEFEEAVTADGLVFIGCWGPDKPMTYDPDDREHPFKGRVGSTSLWLSPAP